ncbi:MAG: hypothetical protein ACOYL6_08990 [Bacteriovoracaceae bacterium]
MFKHAIMLFIPLIFSNTMNMLAVKFNWLPGLRFPINAKLFGANKTYRGFAITTGLNALFYAVVATAFGTVTLQDFLFGAIIGLFYMLSELPNSFIKRRLGIAPGGSNNKYRYQLMFMDKSDSALGVSLAYCLLFGLSPLNFVQLFLGAFLTHMSFSLLLFKIRIKESF